MSDNSYLLKQVLSFVNFPVLRTELVNIDIILQFMLRVSLAVSDYTQAVYDKIDLNMADVDVHIDLCRKTCEALGTANSVPYEILLELRAMQTQLQNVRSLHRAFGEAIVGVPTLTTSEGSGI